MCIRDSYFPAAQKSGDVANNLILAGQAPTYWNEYGIRVDQNFNPNTAGYFRYSYKQEAKTGAANNWGSDPAGQGNQRPNKMCIRDSWRTPATFTVAKTSSITIAVSLSFNTS